MLLFFFLRRLWGRIRPTVTPSVPPPVENPHPVRLPDIWGGYRLRPGFVAGQGGWLITCKHGISGFLFQNPGDKLWCCIVYQHDTQPRMLSGWDHTPEGALMRFLEER